MCRRAEIPGRAGWPRAYRPALARAAAEGSSLHLSISIMFGGRFRHCQTALPQIGPAHAGQALRFGPAPSPDASMIARHEHFRDRAPLPQLGASILRIFEQVLGETLLGQRLGASDDTRQ